jgi:hypothetical protein
VTGSHSQAAIALSLAAGLRHVWMINPTRLGPCAGSPKKYSRFFARKLSTRQVDLVQKARGVPRLSSQMQLGAPRRVGRHPAPGSKRPQFPLQNPSCQPRRQERP